MTVAAPPAAGVPGQKQSQNFVFQWFFDRDITTLRNGDVFNIRLTGQGSENQCLQLNPFIEVKGWGHEFDFARSGGRFYALPHHVAQGGHVGTERQIRVWRDGSMHGQNGTNWVDINLWGFRGNRPFDLHIKYAYTPVFGGQTTQQPPLPPPSVTFNVQGATNLPGSDYRSFWQNEDLWERCQEACRADPACHSFTYVRAGLQGPQARCWLKNAVPGAIANQGCCVSGVKITGQYRR